MKGIYLIPPVIALVAGLGCLLCLGAGWPIHGRELMLAAVISILAAEAAFVPAGLARGSDTATVAQAGLGGTVLQMLLMVALAAMAAVLKLIGQQTAFVWWMLVFYWTSLAAVAGGLILVVRASGKHGAGGTGQ